MEETEKEVMMSKHRTPEEIAEWLKEQKWIRAFARNMKKVGGVSKMEASRILSGQYLHNTVAAGFDWDRTAQGKAYWEDKHRELLKFYYHE